MEIGEGEIIGVGAEREAEAGAIAGLAIVPFADGGGGVGFDVSDGRGKRAAIDANCAAGRAEQGGGGKRGRFEAVHPGAGGGSFEHLPFGMIDYAVFRLAGAAVGPGRLDANEVADLRIGHALDLVVLWVENAGRRGCDETDKSITTGGRSAETNKGAAISLPGYSDYQKIERHTSLVVTAEVNSHQLGHFRRGKP